MPNTEPKLIHVAVGAIVDISGRVLVTQRQQGQHLAGFWEFPGGKVEAGESVQQALARELQEELGVRVQRCEPLIQIPYNYPDKTVLLDVYKVTRFTGIPFGREGQPLDWVPVARLSSIEFPPANKPIITALQLPDRAAITGRYAGLAELLERCQRLVKQGVSIIQYRAPWLEVEEYLASYRALRESLVGARATVFANTHWHSGLLPADDMSHVHISSHYLCDFLNPADCVSAACHNLVQLGQAEQMGADFVFYSPIKPTPSHPGVPAVGWDALTAFCAEASVPVYALGGLTNDDIPKAKACGAQGVAAISAYWGD